MISKSLNFLYNEYFPVWSCFVSRPVKKYELVEENILSSIRLGHKVQRKGLFREAELCICYHYFNFFENYYYVLMNQMNFQHSAPFIKTKG